MVLKQRGPDETECCGAVGRAVLLRLRLRGRSGNGVCTCAVVLCTCAVRDAVCCVQARDAAVRTTTHLVPL